MFPEEAVRGRRTDAMPPGFLEALQDVLEDEYWTRPPLFVAVADPADVRRLLRRTYNAEGRYDDLRLLASLTRDLGTDVGVASLLQLYDRTAEETDRDSLTVPLRAGGETRIARLTERVTLRAEAAFVVVDAASRREVCSESVRADVSRRLRTGRYGGRVRDLVLNRGERALFDPEALEEAERRIEDDLIDELAERLAGRVYACVERLTG